MHPIILIVLIGVGLSIAFQLAIWVLSFLVAHWLSIAIGCVVVGVVLSNHKTSSPSPPRVRPPPPPPPPPPTQQRDAPSYTLPPIQDVEDGLEEVAAPADAFRRAPEDWAVRARKKGQAGEMMVNDYIWKWKRPKQECLWDLCIAYNANGRMRVTQIDHLVRVPWGILVIETKYYGGMLSQDAHDWRKWIQVTNRAGSPRRYRFNNPAVQNEGHVKAVKALTGLKDNVFGIVVLAGQGERDRAIENSTVRPSLIGDCFAREARPANAPYIETPVLDRAWDVLVKCLGEQDDLRARHAAQFGYTRH